eukprot:399078-Pyramimonas_sp.AAC.1
MHVTSTTMCTSYFRAAFHIDHQVLRKILASTIQENAPMMKELLTVDPTVFLPSIPHLVYQYCFYINYPSQRLSEKNPEIPDDD